MAGGYKSKDARTAIEGQKTSLSAFGTKLAGMYAPTAGAEAERADTISGAGGDLADYRSRVSGLFAAPGYTPDEQNKMSYAATAPIAGAFNAARGDLARKSAVTGNMAYGAGRAGLARDRARMTSEALAGQQGKFADARIQGTQFATQAAAAIPQMGFNFASLAQDNLQGIRQGNQNITAMEGQNVAEQGQLAQLIAQYATQPGFWSKLAQSLVGGGAQVAGAYAGRPA